MDPQITEKLISYQLPHMLQLKEAIDHNTCILDASDTGTGKTYTALALCKYMNKKPFVICPKSVIPSWISVAQHFDMEIFGIANYELLKGCKYYTPDMEKVKCPYMDKITPPDSANKPKKAVKDYFKFYLPSDVMVIFDEAHRCKNYKTVTSRLLLSIKETGCKILLLSATITDKLICFKPFGVVFGFYDDVKMHNVWMRRQTKMYTTKYKNNKSLSDGDTKLDIIHTSIFPDKGSRMKISELGDLFPKNRIVSQSYLCKDYDKVQENYDIINEALEDLKNQESRSEALGKIIKARQKIEMYKVPIFIDLAEEALDNNYSVVFFVNYIETMNILAHHLKTDCLIHGGQNMEERQSCIDDFQANKRNVLIAIMQAGGVGISLHDIHGGHPRMSLISPTWTGQDIKQALGRIHRAGSKTPALQKIIYCAKTYEDILCKIIQKKISTISAINDGDLLGPAFDKEEYTEIAENVDHASGTGSNNTVNTLPDTSTSTLKKSKKTFSKKVKVIKNPAHK
jgi:hypothetical protein